MHITNLYDYHIATMTVITIRQQSSKLKKPSLTWNAYYFLLVLSLVDITVVLRLGEQLLK